MIERKIFLNDFVWWYIRSGIVVFLFIEEEERTQII